MPDRADDLLHAAAEREQQLLPAPEPVRIEPLPYQTALRDYLKTEEREVWNWFASNPVRSKHAEHVRLDLLRSTYRLERETQPALYAHAEGLAARFGIRAPITFYQAQTAGGLNASLAYVPGEVHLVLHGPILSALAPLELHALLAHELAHFLMFDDWAGEFLVTGEVVRALANDPSADPCHVQTARLLGLYGEIFADRGSLLATADVPASVAALVKIHTGLSEVNAESYLRQAEEIFSKSSESTREMTHPELYIRARALKLWAEGREAVEAEIARMIEGAPALEALDLVGRRKIEQTTRRLIGRFLSPRWLQTELLVAHARMFFEDFDPAEAGKADGELSAEFAAMDDALRDYFCYVLLDFSTADRNLEELPLSAALVAARELGLAPRLSELAVKELGLAKKRFAKIDAQAEQRVAEATQSGAVNG